MLLDIIIGVGAAASVVILIVTKVREAKGKGGCCGNCSQCRGNCNIKQKKKK